MNKIYLNNLVNLIRGDADLIILDNSKKLIYFGQVKNCCNEVDKKFYEMPITNIASATSDNVDDSPVIVIVLGE